TVEAVRVVGVAVALLDIVFGASEDRVEFGIDGVCFIVTLVIEALGTQIGGERRVGDVEVGNAGGEAGERILAAIPRDPIGDIVLALGAGVGSQSGLNRFRQWIPTVRCEARAGGHVTV